MFDPNLSFEAAGQAQAGVKGQGRNPASQLSHSHCYIAASHYSLQTGTTLSVICGDIVDCNHGECDIILKIRFITIIFRNQKCFYYLLNWKIGRQVSGKIKTIAFQDLSLNNSYFLIMGKVGMKVSSLHRRSIF